MMRTDSPVRTLFIRRLSSLSGGWWRVSPLPWYLFALMNKEPVWLWSLWVSYLLKLLMAVKVLSTLALRGLSLERKP